MLEQLRAQMIVYISTIQKRRLKFIIVRSTCKFYVNSKFEKRDLWQLEITAEINHDYHLMKLNSLDTQNACLNGE